MTKEMVLIGVIYTIVCAIAFWVDDRLEKEAIKRAELGERKNDRAGKTNPRTD